MLLYIWIDDYRNLRNLGFNLSTKYEFKYLPEQGRIKEGHLFCKENRTSNLFKDFFSEIKAIIGKNGTGKSSFIFSLLQSILSDYPRAFTGFIVTDKYIFNRNGYVIEHTISLDHGPLIEIKNKEISNYFRQAFDHKLTEDQAKSVKGGRIADTFLNDYSFFYYSSLLNYDRIYEGDTIIAGHQVFEIDYDKYFDLSTEAQIIADNYSFAPFDYLNLRSESELLTHKSKESERILEYLLEHSGNIPFEVKVPSVFISLNEFSINFWESIGYYFKTDNQIDLPLIRVLTSIENYLSNKSLTKWQQFKNELLKRVLYFLLRYELNHRYNFGNYGKGNALTFLITFFESKTKNLKTIDGVLKRYLSESEIFSKDFASLYMQISSFVNNLHNYYKKGKIAISLHGFEVDFKQKSLLKELIKIGRSFKGIRKSSLGRERVNVPIPIFSYDFHGLSGGEKSYLHMLSRFNSSIKTLTKRTKNVLVILDEPEVSFHPQWQKEFISIICKFFQKQLAKYNCQIILTGHSPIVISDLPTENIIFLNLDEKTGLPYVAKLIDIDNTFAANIHSLYADAFFIQKGAIGEFARETIQQVIEIIQKKISAQKEYAWKIIQIIGDELIKQRLQDMYIDAFEKKEETLEEQKQRVLAELDYINSKIYAANH